MLAGNRIVIVLSQTKYYIYIVMWRWTWSNSGSGGCNNTNSNNNNATATATGNRWNHVQTTARACNKKLKCKSLPLRRFLLLLFIWWLLLLLPLLIMVDIFSYILICDYICTVNTHYYNAYTIVPYMWWGNCCFCEANTSWMIWNGVRIRNAFDFTCCCFVFSSSF